VARALVENGVDLLRIDKGAAKLESIFLELTAGRDAGGAPAASPSPSPELPQ
jgi:hypothetical protein